VTIHMRGHRSSIVFEFSKDLVAHQTGVETRDLFLIIIRANGQVQVTRSVGVREGIAARQGWFMRRRALMKCNVKFCRV
jgi:hypothetical protein